MVGVYYLVLVIICLCNFVSCIKHKECPEICTCLGSYVDCASKKLEAVPSNLPKWTTHLYLHNNAIRKLDDNVWKNLTELTELKLNKNNIAIIPKDGFSFQKHLKILELNRNQLQTINALTFQSLQHLTTLKLKKNRITQLLDGAFYGLQSIDKLILDYNFVQTISKSWLYGLQTLKELSISHNNINRIEIGAWEFCKILTYLDLSFNQLDSITSDTFKNLGNVQKLNLNNNNISVIQENAFDSLSNLKILHLSNNKIAWTVEDANGVFQSLGKLLKFHLAGNGIKSINSEAFKGLNSLNQLNLSNNNITTIQENAFSKMPLLTDLALNSSALLCDFNIGWFTTWLKEHNNGSIEAVCAYPPELKGKALQSVDIDTLSIDELPKPRLLKDLEPNIMALKGENISLECTARSSSSSDMTFHWKKDNMEMDSSAFTIRMATSLDGKNTDAKSELKLTAVTNHDAGKYQCVVSNTYGATYSQKANISVLIFPAFLKTPANVTVKTGDTVKLECSAYGEPQPEIAWRKDGGNDFPAARERRMVVMPTDDTFFIVDVKPSDMGVYSCTAHNAAGTAIANATLTVQEKPSFVRAMENKEVTAGDMVVLRCMVAGTPKPSIYWMKDGTALNATERHFFTAEEQLMVIVDTVETDSGLYQCFLNNSLGNRTASSHLTVKSATFNFNTRDTLGILIITVVCCAVFTSLVWVVIIYQTRLRMTPSPPPETSVTIPPNFPDNASDRSSCKDSGTGDSAKRSSDDLAPEDFGLVVEKSLYGNADTHVPLLHYPRSTNHDRPMQSFSPPPPAQTESD